MKLLRDILGLIAVAVVCDLASTALDPVGAEARRALTDKRLAAFLEECAAA